jgi:thymidylate kinase
MIISFSGLDGSGKSTQIQRVKKRVQEEGGNAVVLWSRGGYTPGFKLLKKLVRLMSLNRLPEAGSSERRSRIIAKPIVRRIWLTLALLDLMVFYGIYVRFLDYRGYTVICDRYIDDSRLDFVENMRIGNLEDSWIWKVLVLLSPKADLPILLEIQVDLALERSRIKNDEYPVARDALERRFQEFASIKHFGSYVRVDSSESEGDVFQAVWAFVCRLREKCA